MRPDLSKPIYIEPKVQHVFDEFKREMKKTSHKKIIMFFIIPVSIFFFILYARSLNLFFFFLGGGLIILWISMLVTSHRDFLIFRPGSNNEWYKNCMEPILKQLVEDIRFEEKPNDFPGLNHWYNPYSLGKELYEYYIMPYFDYDFTVDGLYENLYNNDDGFAFMNVEASSKVVDKDKKEMITTVFKGTLFAVKLDFSLSTPVYLYSTKNVLGLEFSPYRTIRDPIEVENVEFNKNFQVCSDDQVSAFRFLSPLVIENLLELRKKYPKFGMCAKENYLIFTIQSKKWLLSQPTNIFDINKYSFYDAIEEVKDVLDLMYSVKEAVDTSEIEF